MVEKFWIYGLLFIWIDRLILLPSFHVQDSCKTIICKTIIDLRLSIISWLVLIPAVLNVHCMVRLLLINFLFFCNAISCSDRTTFKRKNLILKGKKGITAIPFLDWCHLLHKVAFDKLFSLWQCQTSPKLIRYFFLMWFSWLLDIDTVLLCLRIVKLFPLALKFKKFRNIKYESVLNMSW